MTGGHGHPVSPPPPGSFGFHVHVLRWACVVVSRLVPVRLHDDDIQQKRRGGKSLLISLKGGGGGLGFGFGFGFKSCASVLDYERMLGWEA